MHLSQPHKPNTVRPPSRHSRLLVAAGILSLAALSLLTGAAQSNGPSLDKPVILPEANRSPDANAQMKASEQQTKQQTFDAANAERKKQLSDDSTKLLTLAMALKAEVDKTNKDMLSLNVIRKADEIEKLARNVKEKMRVTAGGS